MPIAGVLETSLYVDDLTTAETFYADVLGLEKLSQVDGRHCFFRCGQGVVLLFDPHQSGTHVTDVDGQLIPLHGSLGPGHVAFAVPEAEIESWRDRLTAHGVGIESEVRWPGGGRSLYFRDPSGNSLELATPKIWGLSDA